MREGLLPTLRDYIGKNFMAVDFRWTQSLNTAAGSLVVWFSVELATTDGRLIRPGMETEAATLIGAFSSPDFELQILRRTVSHNNVVDPEPPVSPPASPLRRSQSFSELNTPGPSLPALVARSMSFEAPGWLGRPRRKRSSLHLVRSDIDPPQSPLVEQQQQQQKKQTKKKKKKKKKKKGKQQKKEDESRSKFDLYETNKQAYRRITDKTMALARANPPCGLGGQKRSYCNHGRSGCSSLRNCGALPPGAVPSAPNGPWHQC